MMPLSILLSTSENTLREFHICRQNSIKISLPPVDAGVYLWFITPSVNKTFSCKSVFTVSTVNTQTYWIVTINFLILCSISRSFSR